MGEKDSWPMMMNNDPSIVDFFNYCNAKFGKVTLGYSLGIMERTFVGSHLTTKRKTSYKLDRFRLWEAQHGCCHWCNRECSLTVEGSSFFTVDHIIPLSYGGTNHWRNMVGSCKKCNGNRERVWSKFIIVNFIEKNISIPWEEWNYVEDFSK